MTAPTLTLAEVNLGNELLFEQGNQYDAFRLLRREDPVHWNEGNEEVKGWWDITRYEDALFVSRHTEIFSSERGIVMYDPRDPELATAAANGNGKMLITMDPPRHVRLRRLVNKGFTPRAVAALEPHIRKITNEILDSIAPKGSCDFVIDAASQLPLAVICEMMGLDKKDWPLMFELTNKVLGSSDPEYQTDAPEELRGTNEGARIAGNMGTMQMFGFFAQKLMERRAASSGEDLISVIIGSEVDGEHLSDEDILWFCFLLILAGNETTRNGISRGLMTLCEHPAELARLRADLSLLPSAVEEILRFTSPVTHMARVAQSDTEIRGKKIRAGERVVIWYPSVNRDEDVFPNADTFDITRTPNEHLAFGIGEHFCLGAGFARLELKVMFEQVLTRFPDIHLNGPVERLRSSFIGGVKHLPVAFTPR